MVNGKVTEWFDAFVGVRQGCLPSQYGSESWTLRKADMLKLEAFEMRCLRSILGVRLLDKVKNVGIRHRLNITKKTFQRK